MAVKQIKEATGTKEANRFLKRGWKLLRCLVQQGERREVVVFVLTKA
jgi:hypothetical protein